MRMTALSSFALLLTLAAAASSAQEVPSWAGTWTLDTAKSSCAGTESPLSETGVISEVAGGSRYVIDAKYKEESVHMEVTLTSDGRKSAVTGNPEYVDSATLTESKPGRRHIVMMKDGKRIEWDNFTLSKSGKRMHANLAGVYEGKSWTCKWVLARQ